MPINPYQWKLKTRKLTVPRKEQGFHETDCGLRFSRLTLPQGKRPKADYKHPTYLVKFHQIAVWRNGILKRYHWQRESKNFIPRTLIEVFLRPLVFQPSFGSAPRSKPYRSDPAIREIFSVFITARFAMKYLKDNKHEISSGICP